MNPRSQREFNERSETCPPPISKGMLPGKSSFCKWSALMKRSSSPPLKVLKNVNENFSWPSLFSPPRRVLDRVQMAPLFRHCTPSFSVCHVRLSGGDR